MDNPPKTSQDAPEQGPLGTPIEEYLTDLRDIVQRRRRRTRTWLNRGMILLVVVGLLVIGLTIAGFVRLGAWMIFVLLYLAMQAMIWIPILAVLVLAVCYGLVCLADRGTIAKRRHLIHQAVASNDIGAIGPLLMLLRYDSRFLKPELIEAVRTMLPQVQLRSDLSEDERDTLSFLLSTQRDDLFVLAALETVGRIQETSVQCLGRVRALSLSKNTEIANLAATLLPQLQRLRQGSSI